MSSQQTNEASKFTAIKDQAVGAVKEAIGNVLGNNKMELEGKAQKVHGKNEYQYAKALKDGETEPQKFQEAYHPQEYLQVHETEHLQAAPTADQAQPSAAPVPAPPAPKQHSTEPSQMSAWKDQAVGAMKENWGEVTNNPQMEMKGKAQNIQGKNEADFVKAQKEGRDEPQHFEHGTKTTEHAEGSVEGDKVSSMSAMKDKAMGSLKENWGSATGNTNAELEGKAQQMHGRNEAEFVKAQKQGLNEPEHYAHGTKETHHAEGKVEGDKVSSMTAMKDKAMGSLKENWGSATGNTNAELMGKAQQMHGRNEAEFAKAQKQGLNEPEHYTHGTKETHHAEGKVEGDKVSTLGAIKDRAMGSMKETFGSMTGNQDMELKGKAQNMHGRNEAAFAKAQKEGLSEPEHFGQGLKTTEHAEGSVEGDKVSSFSAMKDKALGSLKENWGSVTGNTNAELEGKAQQMHGRNEAEFAKAQKQGLNEPEHYAHGTKTTNHAQGEVVSEGQPSKMSGWKDQAVGSVKESFGNMMNNEKMELEGKAQKMQGSNACARADAQKNTMNA